MLEVMFDSFPSEPSNERSCDLVTQCVTKQRGVSGADTRFVLDYLCNIRSSLPVDQIAGILLRGKSYHHAKAVLLSNIEKLAARRRMRNANGIKSVRCHQSKISV